MSERYKLVPVEPTAEMERAAESYWNERRFKALSDNPRTWSGVYQAMLAAAPDVQGEAVAYISHTSEGDILGWERQFDAPSHTPLTEQPECGCCGQTIKCDDDCDAVVIGGNKPAPDITALVEALERIARHPRTRGDELGYAGCRNIAKEALAAHRKGAQP